MSLGDPEVTTDGGMPAHWARREPSLDVLATPLGQWPSRAVCAGHATPFIFDAPDAETHLAYTAVEMAAQQQQAARTCARCPVRAECYADAIDNGHTGVRGGVLIAGSHGAHLLEHDLIALDAAGRLDRPAGGRGRPRKAA